MFGKKSSNVGDEGAPVQFNQRMSDIQLSAEQEARKAMREIEAAQRSDRVKADERIKRAEERAEAQRLKEIEEAPGREEGPQPKSKPDDEDKLVPQKQPPEKTSMDDFAVNTAKPVAQRQQEKDDKSKIPSAERVAKESKPS